MVKAGVCIFSIPGQRCLADISRHDVDLWLQGLIRLGLAPATINRILAVLRSLCRYAEVHGIILPGQSPCQGLRDLRVHSRRERYLTQEEALRLKHALQHMHSIQARIIELLLLTGARKSEILKARWEDLRLEHGILMVPISKSNRPRYITLSPAAVSLIRSLPRLPGCPWLFPGRSPDKPLSDIYHFWNRLRSSLGLEDVRIHDLRHTFASILVNEGHSLYAVQRLLGHADPRTSMRYAHLSQAVLFAAAHQVSRYLAYAEKQESAKLTDYSGRGGKSAFERGLQGVDMAFIDS